MRAAQAMQLVLGHVGLDGRQLQDLMSERVRIAAGEGVATGAALLWQEGNGAISRQEGPLLAFVPKLAAGPATRGQAWRAAFDRGRIAGGRPRGVGRILVETLLEQGDLLLEMSDLLVQLPEKIQNSGLGSCRDGIPERLVDWR
jgi:hypothetical protein